MNLQDLRYLVSLFDERHFGRAAAACHVSQPTVSAAIRKLEGELAVQLFERNRRRVLPTHAGEEIVTQARRVLAEAEQLEALARRGARPLVGEFRLGAIPTVGPYLLPHIVPALRRAHPELRLLLEEDLTARLLAGLRGGRLDAILASPPIDDTALRSRALYQESFELALPPGHVLARKRRIRSESLLNEPMLLLDEGHCLRDQVLEICHRPGSPLRELLRASSLETLRSMVAAGVGCTLLPQLAVRESERQGIGVEIRPIMAPVPRRTIGLYWRQGFAQEDSADRLASFIGEQLPPGVRPAPRS